MKLKKRGCVIVQQLLTMEIKWCHYSYLILDETSV